MVTNSSKMPIQKKKKMIKKVLSLLIIMLSVNQIYSQEKRNRVEPFYVNVFVNANRTIYVETEKTQFQDIENKISEIIRNKPFKLDQKIIYRIFADENLKLGYIIDINSKMLGAYNENVFNKRYLLNTVELNIDGQDWFKQIDIKKLEKTNKT